MALFFLFDYNIPFQNYFRLINYHSMKINVHMKTYFLRLVENILANKKNKILLDLFIQSYPRYFLHILKSCLISVLNSKKIGFILHIGISFSYGLNWY